MNGPTQWQAPGEIPDAPGGIGADYPDPRQIGISGIPILPIPANGIPRFPGSFPEIPARSIGNRGKIPNIFPIPAQSGSGKSRLFPRPDRGGTGRESGISGSDCQHSTRGGRWGPRVPPGSGPVTLGHMLLLFKLKWLKKAQWAHGHDPVTGEWAPLPRHSPGGGKSPDIVSRPGLLCYRAPMRRATARNHRHARQLDAGSITAAA